MHRRAMTLSETLIATALIGLVLTMVALGITAVRTDMRTRQTWDLLRTLAAALDAYHEQTGAWPLDDRDDYLKQSKTVDGPDGSAEYILKTLHGVAASEAILARVPEVLRDRGGVGPAWTVVDGWGRQLRCLTAASGRTLERQAVAANGGKPIFVSAGGDGRFGTENVAAAADNLLIRPSPQRDTELLEDIDMSGGELGIDGEGEKESTRPGDAGLR